jgi:glycosyltransferase involved in cell wall biosynthesis
MVGDGPERAHAEHRARALDVHKHCAFVGKQPKIVDYLSAADVLLLPSEQESSDSPRSKRWRAKCLLSHQT